jgi:hypothetical protein
MSGGALIALPVLTGAVLAVLGTDLVVSLAAIVGGMIAGWLAMSVFMIVGMGIWDSDGGQAIRLADKDRPSRGEHLFGNLMMVLPPLVASGATLMSAQLLAGVSRPLIGVALLVLGLVAGIIAATASLRRSAGEAARRAKWLRDRDAATASDPEFAEQLRTEGWRADGPYDEMRAAYFRAWERVKEARRASGRPNWPSSDEALERPRNEPSH